MNLNKTFFKAVFYFDRYVVEFYINNKPCKHFYDVWIIDKKKQEKIIISTNQAANKSNAISLIKNAIQQNYLEQ